MKVVYFIHATDDDKLVPFIRVTVVKGKAVLERVADWGEASLKGMEEMFNNEGVVGLRGIKHYPREGDEFLDQLRFAFHGSHVWCNAPVEEKE